MKKTKLNDGVAPDIMELLGITAKEIAKEYCVSISAVNDYINGIRKSHPLTEWKVTNAILKRIWISDMDIGAKQTLIEKYFHIEE